MYNKKSAFGFSYYLGRKKQFLKSACVPGDAIYHEKKEVRCPSNAFYFFFLL